MFAVGPIGCPFGHTGCALPRAWQAAEFLSPMILGSSGGNVSIGSALADIALRPSMCCFRHAICASRPCSFVQSIGSPAADSCAGATPGTHAARTANRTVSATRIRMHHLPWTFKRAERAIRDSEDRGLQRPEGNVAPQAETHPLVELPGSRVVGADVKERQSSLRQGLVGEPRGQATRVTQAVEIGMGADRAHLDVGTRAQALA